MFTGIITDTSRIMRTRRVDEGLTITFERPRGWIDLKLGESVATNGVCLTVAELRAMEYDCYLAPETLRVSAFGVSLPDTVNLERPLSVGDRFGGHFVQGHVDGLGKVVKIDEADGWDVYLEFAPENAALVVYKGSIAVNGVSLTIAEVEGNVFRVALIPHTLEHTTLGTLEVGDLVNLEFDMFGKYIVSIMEKQHNHAKN